jgi:protein TonB
MERAPQSFRPERTAGLAFVVVLHAAVLWGLMQHRLVSSPQDAMTLFVNFIAPPTPEKKTEPKPPLPRPKPIEKTQPRQIVAETPVVAPSDHIAPPPPEKTAPEPLVEAPSMPLPVGPVALTSELSVACPERAPPSYPPSSRRLGEEGTVLLRVELDAQGKVSLARIATSSGFARLDEAALAAVKTWRCTPATRNGQPVSASARQPFKFLLQGN